MKELALDSVSAFVTQFKPLSTNRTKGSKTLKKACFDLLDHFVRLAIKGLIIHFRQMLHF